MTQLYARDKLEERLTKQSGSPCPSSALVEEPVGIGPGAGTSFAEEEGHSLAVEEGSCGT